jgi:hypothetical protein
MQLTAANPYLKKEVENSYMNIMLFFHGMVLPTIFTMAVVAIREMYIKWQALTSRPPKSHIVDLYLIAGPPEGHVSTVLYAILSLPNQAIRYPAMVHPTTWHDDTLPQSSL